MMINLKSRIQNRQSTIAIIGLGYVGLPLAIRFSEEGFKTIGFDIDKEKVDLLNNGKSYIKHIKKDNITAMANNGFTATTEFGKISNVDVIIICVPTPLGVQNEPDLSYITGTLENIKPYIKENQLLILESTTYPGTTEEILAPFIESIKNSELKIINQKFTLGVNFFLGYSPEREDPGNKNFNTQNIPKVVSGHTKNCLEVTKALYDQIVDKTVPVCSTKVAEMTKILENIHRAVNIGLVNEMKIVADKMGIDILEVIEAAATKPFGFTPYYPGPGLGGHCIPIDPFYLTWKAKQFGIDTRFIELAGEINTSMPEWVIEKMKSVLQKQGQDPKNANILVLGVAYKKNVDDLREAPALGIIEKLLNEDILVDYHDPFLLSLPKTRKYNLKLESIDLTAENVKKYDCILLITDHDNVNYDLLIESGKLIIDTRGRLRGNYKNVITA